MVNGREHNLTWWDIIAIQSVNLEDIDVPDFVALDKDKEVILIAEVRGNPFDSNRNQTKDYAIIRLIEHLQVAKALIPFAMFVDLENIFIFQWDGKNLSEPIMSLKTADVLSHYEPEFSNKQIFNLYLITLVEAWLRDLAYHWKSKTPPLSSEIAKIGLLHLLEDGTTQTDFNCL